jgi:hypothetical protein
MEKESEVMCTRKFTGTIGILLETKLEGKGRKTIFSKAKCMRLFLLQD